MAWSGGTFTRANGSTEWQDDAALGIGIEAGLHDAQDNDLATGINNCLTKDGQNTPTANLPMGGFKHTGAGVANANGQYTTYDQLRDSSFTAALASVAINNTANFSQTNSIYAADATPVVLRLQKSRGATVGTNTIVQTNDIVGRIEFMGANGTGFDALARIYALVDGTPGASADMPGALVFATSAEASATPAERMRIDDAGNVGIGRNNPGTFGNLEVGGSAYAATSINSSSGSGAVLILAANGTSETRINTNTNHPMVLYTNNSERARFHAAGGMSIGTTSADPVSANVAGTAISNGGNLNITKDAAAALYVNRKTSDGDLLQWYKDGALVGAVSVAAGTVTYGPFCGYHWSQLSDGTAPAIAVGTVMESINELCEWPDETEERLPKCKISDTVGSSAVYGVFMAWDGDWIETNDMSVASVGAYFCRVAAGTVLQIGDLLESAGNGMAQVQADDIVRSKTIGKVTALTQSHIEQDGSFCVPTVLCCG